MKRTADTQLVSPSKRSTGLVSPPVTPVKNRINDITNTTLHQSRVGVKKLQFNSPPNSPCKPKNTSVYSQAKALFQRSSNGEVSDLSYESLVSREQEAQRLNQFLRDNLNAKKSASLYISGPPGTGKTAQTELSFEKISKEFRDLIIVRINCMTILNPENIFHEIYYGIDKEDATSNRKKHVDDVVQLLQTYRKGQIILFLDELDYLITRDQQVLFQIFSLVRSSANIIIVGISNALDLTSKFIPRLKSNNLSPESLQFMPYTAEQIKSICISKLKSLVNHEDKENKAPGATCSTSIPIIHPAALSLCCKKSASITGDLRKAFDICYKGIEMVENSLRKSQSIESINEYTWNNAPKVLISHIAKVCASSFGVNVTTRLTNLNLVQKALLCSLVNLQTMRSGEIFSVNQFYDHYMANSAEESDKLLGKLKKGEFLEVVTALEAVSVVNLSATSSAPKYQEISARLIKANVSYFDLQKAIGDLGVLQKILHR